MNNDLREVVFSGIVAVRDRLLQLPDPLRLESGEPSFDTPGHIKEAMARALVDNQTHYAPSVGIKPLRESILKKVSEKNGVTYLSGIEAVAVTNGGMHALYCSMRTILNAGDEVIIPQPNWTATYWIISLCGAKPIKVRLRPELAYRWDAGELAAAITPRTKAILINTPHNPTGGVMNRDDMLAVLQLAEKHKLYIIADEAYEDIIYDSKHISIASVAAEFAPEVRDRIISCFTFSKSYAMTGWRVGYTVCTGEEFNQNLKKMILYSINGVSTPSQYGGIAALEGPQDNVTAMCNEYRQRRDLLFEGVNRTELLTCDTPPGGAFYLYARISDDWNGTSWDLVNHLIDKYSLGSVPGDVFYDDHKAIRFSYACSTKMIKRAIESLTA